MSYSFAVRGASKSAAILAVAEEMAAIVKAQPIHARDAQHIKAASRSFIDVLNHDLTQDIEVRVAGGLQSSDNGATSAITGASVNISAALVPRKAAQEAAPEAETLDDSGNRPARSGVQS